MSDGGQSVGNGVLTAADLLDFDGHVLGTVVVVGGGKRGDGSGLRTWGAAS